MSSPVIRPGSHVFVSPGALRVLFLCVSVITLGLAFSATPSAMAQQPYCEVLRQDIPRDNCNAQVVGPICGCDFSCPAGWYVDMSPDISFHAYNTACSAVVHCGRQPQIGDADCRLVIPSPTPSPTPTPPPSGGSCSPNGSWDDDLDGFLGLWDFGNGFTHRGDQFTINPQTRKARVTISNDTDKSVSMGFSSYKMNDHRLSTQQFFDGKNFTICAGETVTIEINVPDCASQVDLWYGNFPYQLDDSNPYADAGHVPHFLDVRYGGIPGGYWFGTYPLQYSCTPTLPACTSVGVSTPVVNGGGSTVDVFAYGVTNAISVTFPTWSEVNGQNELVWYPGTNMGNGTWKATVDLSRHAPGSPEYGNYLTHVYLSSTSTANTFCGATSWTRNPVNGQCQDTNGDGLNDSCAVCAPGSTCTGTTCLIANGAADCVGCNNNGICEPERGETVANCPNDCKPLRCGDTDGDNIYDSCKIGNTGPVCNSLADCFLEAKCVNYQCVAGAASGAVSCATSNTIGTYNPACGCPAGTSPDPVTKQCKCDNGATNPPLCNEFCGNGLCQPDKGENPTTCPKDCGYCSDGGDSNDLYDQCSVTGTGNNYCSIQKPDIDKECLGCDNDNICEPGRGETVANCPNDCKCPAGTALDPATKQCTCTNGAINPPACNQCPAGQQLINGKCVPDCGNGLCEVNKGENPTTCPKDCGYCAKGGSTGSGSSLVYDFCSAYGTGNNYCSRGATTNGQIQAECLGCDNDNICEPERGETVANCPNDCKCPAGTAFDPVSAQCKCTNGAVNPPQCNQCPAGYSLVNGQCVPDCGNGLCEVNKGENPTTCPKDCGYCGSPNPGALYNQCKVTGTGNNYCSLGQNFSTSECLGCDNDNICEPERGETVANCPNDCKCPAGTAFDPVSAQCKCTNGAVNPPQCNQCPAGSSMINGKCVPDCGNGLCEVNKGENPITCPKDCGYCGSANPGALYNQCQVTGTGNNYCSLGQSFSTSECLGCDNDNICEPERGETVANCPNDCKCPVGMLPGPNGTCQCPPNTIRSGNSCVACPAGKHPDPTQSFCVDDGNECTACGCVEKVAEGLDNQPIDIVGNGQRFKYRIIIENRSTETDTALAEYDFNVYDYIHAKQTFTRDIVGNQEDPFSKEGYLTFDPNSVKVEANRNCDGSQAYVSLGSFQPGKNIGSVVEPNVNKTNSSTVNYAPIRISNLKSINNPNCGGSGEWSRVEITYEATAHTNHPGHELKNHGFVQVTNEVLTCNDTKCVNDAQADIIVSKSAIASSNAGTTFFGGNVARGSAVNLTSLQALYESITKTSTSGKPVSNFAGVLLSSVEDLFSSYLRSILFSGTEQYDQAIGSSASGVLRGVSSGTTNPNVTISSEADLAALLMRRADDARIYQATNGLRVNLISSESFDSLTTVVVRKGNLYIDSNIRTRSAGNIAFVVQEGNIVVSDKVSRIDGILVVQNKDYGIIGNGVRTQNPLTINGSVYGNFESKNPKRLLTEDRVIVGVPGVVRNAVTVNYSAKILTLLPPGLKSILTAAQFGQVVGSGG